MRTESGFANIGFGTKHTVLSDKAKTDSKYNCKNQ